MEAGRLVSSFWAGAWTHIQDLTSYISGARGTFTVRVGVPLTPLLLIARAWGE